MKTSEVRKKYLDFMKSKGHIIVPSSSLVPENDPTTLFTGSGMQPMIQYLLGAKHPQGTRIADSQKCFRAEDIEEVGDTRHTTFFEMLGNWSLGDYFKEEQLSWVFAFLTDTEKGLGMNPEKLYVTVFAGDEAAGIPKDDDAIKLWQENFKTVGIDALAVEMGSASEGAAKGTQGGRIFAYDAKENWWSRAGVPTNMPAGEPGGPDSEMFYDFGIEHDTAFGEHCHPACDCGRFMEIGNSVFMAYQKQEDGSFKELEQKNIDFGGGLERLTTAANNNPDVFTIDAFAHIITFLEKESGKAYTDTAYTQAFRIVADHIRGAVFMISDGVLPGNTEQGYFVRRLLRRAVRFTDNLGIEAGKLAELVPLLVETYKDAYPELQEKEAEIVQAIQKEETQFRQTLSKGMKEFQKMQSKGDTIVSGHDAFVLFTTYGFPVELTQELAAENDMTLDKESFDALMKEHKDKSRAGAEQKFKGGLADSSEKTTAFHTATHLMLAGLRKELGDGVTQRGANITSERARFDFTYHEKVQRDVLDRVEEYVNNAMQAGATVSIEEMEKEKAKESGAVGAFWEKYPDVVTVYNIKDDAGTIYSRELCGGPHVESTKDMTPYGTFKIKKESSSSAGVRRIKAVFIEGEV